MRIIIASILALTALGTSWVASAATASPHMQVRLVAENLSLMPGQTSWVALELSPQKGWHSYWRNPGEAGLPTRIQWTLPKGITAGAIAWPAPKELETAGLMDYGYDTRTLLMVPIEVPATLAAGHPVSIAANASWLVCKDICIPGHKQLELQLPVSSTPAQPNPNTAMLFSAARSRLPQPLPQTWQARYQVQDGQFNLGLQAASIPPGKAAFYPITRKLIDYSASQHSVRNTDGLRLSTSQSPRYQMPDSAVRGVLTLTSDDGSVHAYRINAVAGTVAPVPASAAGDSSATTSTALAGPGLWLSLLFALLGGLILNLMPCVFPILSIKAIGVLRAGGLQRQQQRLHGLAYAAGTILSCVAAAALLLALRAGGQALGWGFQLQSPVFVALLACLMFALGLSMSGVIGFGTRFMGAGQKLTGGGGLRGAFFTGVLAVIVASPCTAPFMGTAMGYALVQPTAAALAVFAALGLGLALPFLVIGFVPRVASLLPRPGAWMESFKQLMAFPLYLTAVWLVWVLARQNGADAGALVLVAMVLLALVLWQRHRWPAAQASRAVLVVGVAGVVALSVQAAQLSAPMAASTSETAAAGTAFSVWSPQRVAALRKAGRTVFVDFTADWCLTCKVNERVALDSADARQAFARNDVALLRADWTRRDPAITAALRHFGRAGVPLYVGYPQNGAPRILPQLLTPGLVAS
ncbi:MAG: thioredoxin family protein, partial [Sinobacteraceae bacterium]|nr:thioredoxin family protein [Nevskiaceae bacterium]